MKEIVSRVEDIEPHLKYIFSVLISRTNCHDLDGIEGVPEVMQPSQGQKPKLMTRLIEPNEVARRLLLDLSFTLVEVIEEDEMRLYVNEMVNIVRVFLMDPFGEIQEEACRLCSEFCSKFKDLLYHFTVILSRAILLPLVSKKSSIKIASL